MFHKRYLLKRAWTALLSPSRGCDLQPVMENVFGYFTCRKIINVIDAFSAE
jgi:hypothetical protein